MAASEVAGVGYDFIPALADASKMRLSARAALDALMDSQTSKDLAC